MPCPSYAAIRQSADGRTYVLEQMNGRAPSENSLGARKQYCRATGNEQRAVSARPSLSKRVLAQGEKIMELVSGRGVRARSALDRARREFFANPHRHVWLGVTDLELQCDDPRYNKENNIGAGFQIKQQIGKGSFGAVHAACKDVNCQYVLKVSYFTDDFDREVAAREIAVMQQLNDSGVTVKLLRHQMCPDKALMVMERFDMSAEELGKRQLQNLFGKEYVDRAMRDSLLFTRSQIRAMFQLALQLSKLNVGHGDLKLDNIMYQFGEPGGRPERFVSIDFGFTGTYREFDGKFWPGRWGFTHAMGCDQQKEMPQELIPFVNVWQLLVDLGANFPYVFIADEPPGAERLTSRLSLLVGLGPDYAPLLNSSALAALQRQCPTPDRGTLAQSFHDKAAARAKLLQIIPPFWV
jgi:serine/threonine protein kinase